MVIIQMWGGTCFNFFDGFDLPRHKRCVNVRKNAFQTYVQMITSVVAMADGGVSTLLGLVHTIHGQGWRKLKIFTRHSCGEVFNFTLPAANFTLVWWLAGTFRSIFLPANLTDGFQILPTSAELYSHLAAGRRLSPSLPMDIVTF